MSAPAEPTFALERFTWEAPDRLGLSGWFSGLPDKGLGGDPVIVVRGSGGTHRLPAVSAGAAPPQDGERWEAEFAWQEPPTAFAVAELQLGKGFVVELPEPGTDVLDAGPGAAELRLEAELVAAQEELREVLASLDQSRQELARAREDLEAEHERHAADAEHFRESLARVQASAERALAAERHTAQRLEVDLQRSRDELVERERAATEAEALRGELETARDQRDEAQARLRDAQQPVAEAHAETEQLLRRLTAAATALDGRS